MTFLLFEGAFRARGCENIEIEPGRDSMNTFTSFDGVRTANLIAARATGADPKVLAAVIRGAVAPPWPAEELRRINAPVLILNGTADAANQKVGGLLNEIPTARLAACEGDHHSTPYQPTFHRAVVEFFKEQWRRRGQTPA